MAFEKMTINSYETRKVDDIEYGLEKVVATTIVTIDGTEYQDVLGEKRIIKATWKDVSQEELEQFISALQEKIYPIIRYYDSLKGYETVNEYVITSNPVVKGKYWKNNKKYYEEFTLELKQRRCEVI